MVGAEKPMLAKLLTLWGISTLVAILILGLVGVWLILRLGRRFRQPNPKSSTRVQYYNLNPTVSDDPRDIIDEPEPKRPIPNH